MDLTPIQWAAIAGAAALVVIPRLGSLQGLVAPLAGMFKKAPDNDIHAKVDAFRVISGSLNPDLAKQVWAAIQEAKP
jgi:hypothetical protein